MSLMVVIAILAAAYMMMGPMHVVKDTGLLTRGIRSNFFERFGGVPTVHQDLATKLTSDGDKESYKWLGSPPRMRELGTGILPKGLRGESFDVTNGDYEVSLEVNRNEKEDDQTGQIMIRARELGAAAAQHNDKVIADLLKNGAAADALAYDGRPFFDTAHVSGDSGNQSNSLTTDISAVVPAEPDTPNTPSVRTLQVMFGLMLAQMMQFKDDLGEPLDIMGTGLVVCCHPINYLTWLTALEAGMVANTNNVLPQFKTRVVPMARFTAQDEHYLLKTDVDIRPFILQQREEIRLDALEEGSEHEIKTGNLLYVARERKKMTYGKWFYAVKQNLD